MFGHHTKIHVHLPISFLRESMWIGLQYARAVTSIDCLIKQAKYLDDFSQGRRVLLSLVKTVLHVHTRDQRTRAPADRVSKGVNANTVRKGCNFTRLSYRTSIARTVFLRSTMWLYSTDIVPGNRVYHDVRTHRLLNILKKSMSKRTLYFRKNRSQSQSTQDSTNSIVFCRFNARKAIFYQLGSYGSPIAISERFTVR